MAGLFKRLFQSYNAKIIIVFVAGMVFLAVGLDVAFVHIQRQSYTEHARHNGLTMAKLLAQSMQVGIFSENIGLISQVVEFLPIQDEILQIVVMTDNGRVLLDKKGPAFKVENGLFDPHPPQDESVREASFSDQGNSFVFWQPVMSSGAYSSEDELYFKESDPQEQNEQLIGWLVLSLSKKQFEESIFHLRIKTGVTVVSLLLIAIFCSVFLVGRMMAPLRQLVRKIHNSDGMALSGDDLTVLNATYAHLVERLEQAFITINDLRQGLEIKVEQRTRDLAGANEKLEKRQQVLEEANQKLEIALRELKETQTQLVQSEKMAALGQLVAGVAHEINNNINFITTALPALGNSVDDIRRFAEAYRGILRHDDMELILQSLEKADEITQQLDIDVVYHRIQSLLNSIRVGTTRTIGIVGDLTSFSRRGVDAVNLYNVNDGIESTYNFVDYRYKDKVKLVKEFGKVPPVYCYGDKINQVFLNIMNNAVQSMGEGGGTLIVKTSSSDDHVYIQFSDTGHGIDEAHLGKIFDPFFTTKVVGQGTGLGLGICYQIIREHKGKISVSSTVG
ncbi:MAG: ATP-binding protein, partial [Desulfobulbaceae bacterium]|nr:ATP-binding protein [Desulfobulbaceae bacterium]